MTGTIKRRPKGYGKNYETIDTIHQNFACSKIGDACNISKSYRIVEISSINFSTTFANQEEFMAYINARNPDGTLVGSNRPLLLVCVGHDSNNVIINNYGSDRFFCSTTYGT